MMEITEVITLTAPVANGICLAQKPASGGVQQLNLNGSLISGGKYTADTARRIVVASTGADSSRVFTIYGYDRNSYPLSESITGPGYTVQDFLVVTEVTVDANTAGNITVGTNQVASTNWIGLNIDQTPFNASVFAILSTGAVLTYTVEETPLNTYEQDLYHVPANFIFGADISNMVAASTSQNGIFAGPTRACRLTLNTFTSGTVTFMVKQGF